ncbi:Hypothetical protein SRAE_0000054800 [Strongyloides ratti]|uniref:Uncharacterized protein n=1 Tax=Strongyloides ratti TaxID=34506 RepID=A0A090L1Q2_STRRB|nr:Hypothetical protein SRAE_0000054800 [Strongyloides ratti]CEF61424.1 Hypothetical protein SRAE_0000054800 [Strongyloides ratti]
MKSNVSFCLHLLRKKIWRPYVPSKRLLSNFSDTLPRDLKYTFLDEGMHSSKLAKGIGQQIGCQDAMQ